MSPLELDRIGQYAQELDDGDGVRVFLDVYLTVTKAVLIDAPPDTFEDPAFVHDLGAHASRALVAALDEDVAGHERAHQPRPAARRGRGARRGRCRARPRQPAVPRLRARRPAVRGRGRCGQVPPAPARSTASPAWAPAPCWSARSDRVTN